MQKRAIVSTLVITLVMALVLMASCDPPVMKPTTTTADTGTVSSDNNPQPLPPASPALLAAKAVQAAVAEIKAYVDTVERLYSSNASARLNVRSYDRLRDRIIEAKAFLGKAKTKLADEADDGLKMLSQKAVEAAKAVVTASPTNENANAAVTAAEAVKTAADKIDDPSAYFQTAAAEAHIITDIDLTEQTRADDLAAITAAKTQVDLLKALADAAIAAAEAVNQVTSKL